jgi:hypothetical protein
MLAGIYLVFYEYAIKKSPDIIEISTILANNPFVENIGLARAKYDITNNSLS